MRIDEKLHERQPEAAAHSFEWIEELAGHVLERQLTDPHLDGETGEPSAWERSTMNGIVVVPRRRVAIARADPGKAREMERIARRHNAKSIQTMLLQAAEIDRMVKGLNHNDPWDALNLLACSLAGTNLMKAA